MIFKDKYRNPAFFLIGYSGVGKTTLAEMLRDSLVDSGHKVFLFDGDDMSQSKVLSKFNGRDIDSRLKRAYQLTHLINWIRKQEIIPIVSVIGQPKKAREHWRHNIDGYAEIYLECNLDECIRRDNKNVYKGSSNVIGVDIEFEKPQNPEITLDAESNSPTMLLKILTNLLEA